jgi:hypothetical protein
MTQYRSEARSPDRSRYRSYLLRLWQEAPGDRDRVVLQDVLGGEMRGFPSLESLFAYLVASGRSMDGDEEGGESSDSA